MLIPEKQVENTQLFVVIWSDLVDEFIPYVCLGWTHTKKFDNLGIKEAQRKAILQHHIMHRLEIVMHTLVRACYRIISILICTSYCRRVR